MCETFCTSLPCSYSRVHLFTSSEMHSGTLISLPLKSMWCSSSGLCFLYMSIRNAHLWRATQRILGAGGQRSVWYLPEVLCQGTINRFKGHPLTPNPQHSHQPTPKCDCTTWTHLSVGMPSEKARGSQPWYSLDEKSPAWREALCSFPTGDRAFIAFSEFQEAVQPTAGR